MSLFDILIHFIVRFRVVSYNILSERYTLMDENYSYCEPKFLSIDYRKQIIMKELLGFKAEIICLQEVDNRHFINFFRDQFKRNGYYCYYHKKGNRISEGFAMIFKKSHFKIISSILEDSLKQLSHLHCVDKKEINSMHIVFGLEVLRNPLYSYIWKVIKKNEDLKNEFMKMPTSLQVAVLKCRREKNYLIVGNTHFTYKPESNHLRLLHINMAIAYLEFLRIKYSKESSNVAVILCGDFNSQPDQSLYEYVTKGKIDPYHEDCSKVNENGIIPMFHKLGMESACGTPKFTNYTTDFKGCLDYIFIESAKLEIRRVVPLTKEEELTKHEGLPNEFFPSDHLPLVVDLRFKLQSDF